MRVLHKQMFGFAKIGFIGLGNMGGPMALNLVKNGHEVFGYDVDSSKSTWAKENGIQFIDNIKSIAQNSEAVVTMLPNSEHSIETCEGPNGLFQNLAKGATVIDSSTISPLVAAELQEKGQKQGINYLDAPVSGGTIGAVNGTLTFMVGALNETIFEKAKKILLDMGKNIYNCKKPGAGQTAKICNNMALGIQMVSISEAMALGKKLGMDLEILTQIMRVSSSHCRSLDVYHPVPGIEPKLPSSNNYEGGFGSALMLKDLNIAMENSKAVNCQTELGETTRNIYQNLVQKGKGKKDFAVVYEGLVKN